MFGNKRAAKDLLARRAIFPVIQMVEILFPQNSVSSLAPAELLSPGEVIAVVDDSPEIILLLSHYLNNQGFEVVRAGSSREFHQLLESENIALVLLDIGLPDQDGNEILKDIVTLNPDLGIVMVTGSTDIQIALECLRLGADDYLTKPVSIKQFNHTVQSTLKKRRLAINNRIYQQELQKANTRMRFLHHLNLKMNTAYLNTVELQGILQAILVGITSDDGLRFNRAFLALYNEEDSFLEGRLAMGPASREAAGHVWDSIRAKGLQLDDILETIQGETFTRDVEVNKIIQTLRVSPADNHHVLIYASHIKKPIHVQNGKTEECRVPESLIDILGESSFVVVPLYSPGKSLGVIIVDNFVTGAPISNQDINGLEILASQASLAIEHSQLYAAMIEKISALEIVTQELDKNKDLLVEAERASAIGQMSSQLLHAIRNPLTSIGGTSRLLVKKTKDPYLSNFLNIITKESAKIESILEDLLCFVEDETLRLDCHPIYPLIRKTVMIFYTTMKKNNIDYTLALDGSGPTLSIDDNKVRQVFLHLIRNSLEAMVSDGVISIEAEENEESVTIFLTDSGPGIPPTSLPLIKDPFFTTKTTGIGMGLALVDKIVQEHGGEFTLQNGQQGGTIATVTLMKDSPSPC